MDRKVVGAVFFGGLVVVTMVIWSVTSPRISECSVA